MRILEYLIYGLISGFSEFLPISSRGHQALVKHLFGVSSSEPILDILVHIGMLVAVYISSAAYLDRIKRERKIRTKRKRGAQTDRTISQELRLIRTAALPLLLGTIIGAFTGKLGNNVGWLALFFAVNGIVLYIPEHLTHGNKTAGHLGPIDSILIGLAGAFSFLPGVSRVGSSLSCAIGRGVDQEKAYSWLLVLSIPVLALSLVVDVIGIFTGGIGTITFLSVIGYFIATIGAFAAAFSGIYFMRRLLQQSSIVFFAFYSWSAAFLSFFLYLFA